MKQFFLWFTVCFFCFLGPTLFAQPTNKDLNDVAVLSKDTVIVVGSNGTLFRTTDGGEIWTSQINSAKTFYSVHFVDIRTGWVVGEDGITRKTTNAGKKWLWQPLSAPDLHDVYFVDIQTGWAVGNNGFIAKTSDGGESWHNQSSGTTTGLLSVHFFDVDTGWTVGRSSTILKTTNGGTSWKAMLTGNSPLRSVFFVDAVIGWVVGFGSDVLYTIDGGNHWMIQSIRPNDDTSARAAFFFDAMHGWIVGSDLSNQGNGGIIATIDGGVTWHRQASVLDSFFRSVYFIDVLNGWAVGKDGIIFKTMDGGQTWQQVGGVLVGVEEHEADLPLVFGLSQNYPNPFSLRQATSHRQAQTTIAYELADAAHVNLTVYDILGRAVRTLVNKENPAGAFHVSWNGRDQANRQVASDIYFYRMKVQALNGSEPLVKQMKMLITK